MTPSPHLSDKLLGAPNNLGNASSFKDDRSYVAVPSDCAGRQMTELGAPNKLRSKREPAGPAEVGGLAS